jgi:hypothetical protein
MPESTLTLCQSRLYPQVRDLGFSFCSCVEKYTDGQRCLARDLDFDLGYLTSFGETKMVYVHCTYEKITGKAKRPCMLLTFKELLYEIKRSA